jgi:hypothetical protein
MPASASDLRRAAACALLLVAPESALASDVGPGSSARPALHRAGVPEANRAGEVAAAVTVSGGVTEALSDADSAHGRAAASGAAAVSVARFLDVGARLQARYDRHASDLRGVDDGFLFQPELSSRLSLRSAAWGFGLEAAAWLPGGPDVGTSLSALSADGRLLLSRHASALVLAAFAGYRLDRSAEAAAAAERLRFGDRVALGASDYDQLLCGLGAGYALGRTLLFGEASAQLLLGGPKLSESPLWISLGVRHALGRSGLSVELAFDGLLSSRPTTFDAGAPLVPIEPRAGLAVGLRYRFGHAQAARPAAPRKVEPPPPPVVAAPAAAKPASVELALLDDQGQPLRAAAVTIRQGDQETPLPESEPGRYRVEVPKPGRAKLSIKADGFQPVEREIELGAGLPLRLDVKAEPALPAGQVRGLVRAYNGKPLAASVRVEPAGVSTKTDSEGFFQLDVPPGEYEVVIEAPGYAPQRRKAKVEKQGVVIVNADLSKAP